jgi:tripartite-type tricarboxylate transporter receptor subunit TctC
MKRTPLFVLFAALSLLGVPFAPAFAQYPAKPVRIVVGFPSGTGPDFVARVVAQKLQDAWGKGAVVDNKPGAAGLIAAQEVARAAPDGYTLLLGEVGQLSIAPSTYRQLPYDPQKDFAPITHIVSADFAFVTNPQHVPAKTLQEYLAWAKAQRQLFMATFGAGTPGHFGTVVFSEATGVKLEPIHYKTTADAMSGILGGDVQGLFASIALAAPQVKAGKLRALATTGTSRSPVLPDVATFKELGFPTVEFTAWFGVLAPAKTPAEILDKLNAEIVKAVKSSDASAKLEEAGFRVTGTSREELSRTIRDDTARWAKVVAATGFKAQE